ncbi:MAG: ATP synthase F1 subunit delta [Phycisphaerales bacterium]|nr:ATP synthase F1 subunit delta [Phycisphaerales bacterium]
MPLTEAAPDALARVYAQSLFELASSEGGQPMIEEIGGELEEIVELARGDARFAEFLSSRILAARHREQSLKRIFENRISSLTLRFLLVLNEKDRLGHLLPVAAAFDQLLQAAFGRAEVDVYTAAPVSEQELNQIRDRLRTAIGREPVIHAYTDPSMIGGLKVQIGDQLIDASIATRLRKVRDTLATSGAAAARARFDRMIDEGGNGQL